MRRRKGNPPASWAREMPAFSSASTLKVVGAIGRNAEAIQYQHADDGEMYEHEFGSGVEVLAVLRDGRREILLTSRNGQPLWKDFL